MNGNACVGTIGGKNIDINIDTTVDVSRSLAYNGCIQGGYTKSVKKRGEKMHTKTSVKSLMSAIVPITRFNRGEASKIFDEVRESGVKIAMRNNAPACVLVEPAQYDAMVEALEDYALYIEAQKRLAAAEKTGYLSSTEVMASLGITEADLEGVEVEIE